MKSLLLVASIFLAAPAWAQRIEFAPVTATFTSTAPIRSATPAVDELKIGRDYTFGARATYLISTHTAVEALWTWQNTNMRMGTSTADVTLFQMEISRFDGNFLYTFGENDRSIRPFLGAGLGVSTMMASDVQTESKFAWNAGGGVKWFFTKTLGSRFDARYAPVQLNTRSAAYCAPFSFCQSSLQPFQLQAALLIRF
jgi:outer membrane protein W